MDASPEIEKAPTPAAETKPDSQLLAKYAARIRQLQNEIRSRQEENEQIVADNLKQNEILREFNTDLANKVKLRTWELENSKQKLEQQNKALQDLHQTKESLMHMIVHDMKNPLTAVLGILRFLQGASLPVSADVKQLVEDGHLQGKKLLSMIEQILLVSRMQSREFALKKERINLISLVRDCVNLMTKTLGAKRLRLVFAPQVPEINVAADPSILERVVNNLLNNAIKYAPADTDIEVTAELDTAARVGVSNQGEAIPAQFHQKIFDLFCRVKSDDTTASGTGLGLTFTKLAVEAHGGQIRIESPLPGSDRGARFAFTLPVEQPQT